MNTRRLATWVAAFIAASPAPAQSLLEKVRAHRVAHAQALMEEYREFLAIPNVSGDRENVRRNAEFIVGMMRRRGLAAELLEGKTPGTNPAVFAEVRVPGATKTVVFYAHYDGQPVTPKQWAPGLEPFKPVFLTAPIDRGGQIITAWKPGDASADDKAGVFAILNAYDALVQCGATPKVNVKFFFEGEEEVGSTHLGELLQLHRTKLGSDLWIICDGPRHVSGRKMVVFGVRGDVNMALTAYGARRPLHSGNYGNWAPNPALRLVSLLAGMKDDNGRVLVKGFYDDYVQFSETEKLAVKEASFTDAELLRELGLKEPEVPGRSLLDGFELPTLNINGIGSANVGREAANIIPSVARATLDLRQVLGTDWQRQVGRVVEHIKAQGWHVIDHEPTDEERAQFSKLIRVEVEQGYNAQRTPMSLSIAQAVVAAVQSTTSEPVIKLPTAGGSLPLIIIEQELGAKVITVPAVNYDNNQHAENENVLVRYLWDGIETFAALMTMP
jgi:acetylornithine deacetylase/succinyl-diaminopimelate desuccinylase-like protein